MLIYLSLCHVVIAQYENRLRRCGIDCRDLVRKLLTDADSRMQYCEKEVSSACVEELPRSIVKVYNVLYPYTFSKDIFSNLQVSFLLQQIYYS
jgi:hypothetical protein